MPTTYAIPDGRVAMAATLYTGNGSTQTISNAVNGVAMQPDWVWIKSRNNTYSHILYDVIRGTGTGASLSSDSTGAEGANSVNANMSAFTSTGFTVGTTSSTNILNNSGGSFVGWQWKAGGTAVSNTAGSVTSTVSANTTAGFSVATYIAPSGTFTFGHGLGVTPNFVIIKRTDSTSNWQVWVTGFTAKQSLYLNATNGADASGANWFAVNSSTVQITTGQFTTTGNYLAYCFAPVAGYSAFGSYTGNGSADGPFVYTGFRPRYLLVKRTDSAVSWIVIDTSRNPYNVSNFSLLPNGANAEITSSTETDILSNGFKIRTTDVSLNASGGTYIYACFAENPFKYANAR